MVKSPADVRSFAWDASGTSCAFQEGGSVIRVSHRTGTTLVAINENPSALTVVRFSWPPVP